MEKNNTPIVKDLVLIGGGHSHIAVLKMLGMKPLPGLRITLITRDVHTPYSGMLPGYIAGHYEYDEAHIDLRPLAIFARARLFHTTAEKIDFDKREIHCTGRPPVKYDALSINIGSRPSASHIPGASEYALPVKPIDCFLEGWEDIVTRVSHCDTDFNLTIVGTGAGGVEMALATQYRLRHMLKENGNNPDLLKVTLIGANQEILPTHNARVRKKFLKVLAKRKIQLLAGEPVTRVNKDSVELGNRTIDSNATIWVTHASAQPWPTASGLATDEAGFIQVNDYLQSTSHPEVFAAGDIAAVVNHPREKSGVFAVRQGPPLTENLRRFLRNEPLKAFTPQTNFLGLISTGDQYAIASRGSWSLQGKWLWKWKDWIDRRFMQNFSELPDMSADESQNEQETSYDPHLADATAIRELSSIAMRCGGCGAKVGSTILSRVVNRLNAQTQNQRDDVLIGIDSPDDAAILSVPPGMVMVQSVDYFRAFIDDDYTFGRIAANHALGDVFAMGAEAQSALAIATLPYGREEVVEDQLYQVMSGALSILRESNCMLVGGHSSEGAELSFGLTVNGIANPDNTLRKNGMQRDQAIILTKPLGTGTIMAADMRGKAKGRWVHAALSSMMQSSQQAAAILMQHSATACTDVTGFGLLGHLVEMTRASNVDATLYTDKIPVLDGAVTCIENGIFSSLQPQNFRLRRAIAENGFDRNLPIFSLLFDPQTAGGMLASLPADSAQACADALREAGYSNTAIIGKTTSRQEQLGAISLL